MAFKDLFTRKNPTNDFIQIPADKRNTEPKSEKTEVAPQNSQGIVQVNESSAPFQQIPTFQKTPTQEVVTVKNFNWQDVNAIGNDATNSASQSSQRIVQPEFVHCHENSEYFDPFRIASTKDVITLVVENSKDVLNCKNEVLAILNNIVKSRSSAAFLIVKVGSNSKNYPIKSYEEIIKEDIISYILSENENNEEINWAPSLFYVRNMLESLVIGTFTLNNIKYKLNSCSIICIGSGSFIDDKIPQNIITSCIMRLKSLPKLKSFKFFCTKDSDAIKVASLGFPVIGHIISNYYK